MKLYYHLLISLTAILTLTSCEQLGIEVTTIKGKWETNLTDRQSLKLTITSNNTFEVEIYKDSIKTAKTTGTWQLSNDTLLLYSQRSSGQFQKQFTLEQMRMNSITLRAATTNIPTDTGNTNAINANRIYRLHRLYSTPQPAYNQKFLEVLYIKHNYWAYYSKYALLLTATLIATTISSRVKFQ